VTPGQEILTSGEDQIFPKDLLVGTVVRSKNGNPFAVINVRPAARLDRLEEVLVLLSRRDTPNQKKAEPAVAPVPTAGAATPSAAAPSAGDNHAARPRNPTAEAARHYAGASVRNET
jgi:rod shape-determining protein MreC